jgi:ABC-2 type transport system ATP-binding protein
VTRILERAVIHTRKLNKNFTVKRETIEAVKGVDIDVAPGELVAFLGPNGAGKSTTLRMLTTLLRPTSGTARVAGVDVSADPAGVRARIGYIGQGNGGGHSFRVIDELVMQGRFYGMNTTDAAARAQELLKSLDLADLAKRTVIKLSGGQRRRMDVALGLMHSPRLLFLDEPSTGMDPQNRANLWWQPIQPPACAGCWAVQPPAVKCRKTRTTAWSVSASGSPKARGLRRRC